MVLVLVIHSVEVVSATVPVFVILLNGYRTNKQIPEPFKLRQLTSTSGQVSTSVWDITDLAFFEQWLNEALGEGVQHSIFHINEEFSYGLMSGVKQSRAADKAKQHFSDFSSSTRQVVTQCGSKINEFNEKYEISERTSQTFKKVSDAATLAKQRALENPAIATVSTNMTTGLQTGLKSVGEGFAWARDQFVASLRHPETTVTSSTESQNTSTSTTQTQSPQAPHALPQPPPQT